MTDDRNTNGSSGSTRRPDPQAAAQDPENARRQEQMKADHDALQEQRRRVDATTPADIKDKRVDEIVAESDRRAERDRNDGTAR